MQNDTKKPVYKKWWFWAISVFVLFILIGSMSDGSKTPKNDIVSSQTVTPIVSGEHVLGLTIDDARKELGTPDDESTMDPTAQQLTLGTDTWTNQFTVSSHTIVLDFDVKSRQVTGFFISTDEAEGITKDWKSVMQLGGLSDDAQGYMVKPVEALKNPGYYTGVQATE